MTVLNQFILVAPTLTQPLFDVVYQELVLSSFSFLIRFLLLGLLLEHLGFAFHLYADNT